MVASEANPFVKTGGLGDVVYSLSKELTILGEEVIIVLPFYEYIKRKQIDAHYVTAYFVDMSWRHVEVKVYRTYVDGIVYYLIDNPRYFSREHVYGDFDDGERFAFFTVAVKELFYQINFKPDIIHVHDWQAGMLPVLIKESHEQFFANTRHVLTIHNPAFQGLLPKDCLGEFYNLDMELYYSGKVRFKEQISTLKSAIVYADKITTVSPNHRFELSTREGGMDLDSVLNMRSDDFVGILNGIDTMEWNPKSDEYIPTSFTLRTNESAKEKNKKALCEELHIQYQEGKALYSIVSRLTWQKGMDLAFLALENIASNGHNIVILGSGEWDYENKAEDLRRRYPDTVAIYIGYNNELSHKIYASSDFFLMPSLFEPCGIGQMLAQRYGALPIVRLTGGLKDTVEPFNGNNLKTATGFGFYNYNYEELMSVIRQTYDVFNNKELRKVLMNNAMKRDNSWKLSATKYIELYQDIISK